MANADRIIELLHEAKARPAGAQRDQFLATACADDPALKEQIVSLLEADAREGESGFLKLTQNLHPTIPPTAKPGDRIGRYLLLEQVGEGGCGVVYMAEQEEPVRRRVALKVIKLGMDTRQVIARFEAERQALAMMDHPNIAKVLDGGATETGRPFFVMELVRGIRITDYCDQNNLATKERLELFIQVCQAIQHAHQKGVIHRDIKPSNILVTRHDDVAVPKVIDFGIAKATIGQLTDKTVFTAFAQFIGTPAYMSPEQAQMSGLDVDTRADVYSLGVLLYELLTGHTPFDAKALLAAGMDEMRRRIREDQPAKPSTRLSTMQAVDLTTVAKHRHVEPPKLIHLIRGDLDWVVMKCLEKDRTRRYETANGLAMDLRRHLDNQPIAARPPSRWYEFQKFVRRHKFGFGAATALIIVLGLGVLASTWQAIRATHAEREENRLREQAERARTNEARERAQAETNRKKAESEAAKSQQVARFLTNMLHGVGPSVAQGRDTALLRDILDKTADRVAHDLRGQPEVQGDLYFTLGQTYSDLTTLARAEEMFTRALEGYRSALPAPHNKLVFTLGLLAVTQAAQGNTAAGKPRAEEALWMARALGEPRTLVAALRHQARALDPYQDIPEAVPFLREALALQRQLDDDPATEGDLLRQLGGCLAWETNLSEAEECLRAALELHRRHLATNDLSIAQDHYNLAQVLTRQRRFAEAQAALREAIDIARPALDPGHQNLIDYIAFLAHVLILRDKWDEAETLLQEAVAHSPDSARYRNLLGSLYARQRRWAEAAAEFQRGAAIPRHANYVPLDPVVAMLKAGKTNECLELWRTFQPRLANTREFDVADKLAKMGLLLPLNETELARAGELADYASTAKEPAWLVPWMQFVKALADFRRGRFQSAVDWSILCLDNPSSIPPCQAGVRFIQAMAFARLNQAEAAQSAFAAGNKLMAGAADYTTGNFDGYWVVWSIAELLERDAAGVLQLGDTPPAPAP